MRRLLAIVLLAMLPLQFSWAAVVSYCGHEKQGAGHFGHHEHEHNAALADGPESVAEGTTEPAAGKLPGAVDIDCGQCHGQCSVMPTLLTNVPGSLSAGRPGATLDEPGGAHAPARPERPQWRLLA